MAVAHRDPATVVNDFFESEYEVLELPMTLSVEERQQYNQVAAFYGLQHFSQGENERFVTLAKPWVICGISTFNDFRFFNYDLRSILSGFRSTFWP